MSAVSPRFGGKGEVIPVNSHPLLLVVPALACIGVLAAGGDVASFVLVAIVYGPLLWCTVLIHELGHCIMASRVGYTPVEILLWPLGGLASIASGGSSPKDRLWISAAGPGTHGPMMLVWLGLAWMFSGFETDDKSDGWYSRTVARSTGWGWFQTMAALMFSMNWHMMLFNLVVPCVPLDGAIIAVNVQLLWGRPKDAIAFCMVVVSSIFGTILVAYGLYSLVVYGGGALALFMGAWIGHQTWLLWQARKNGQLEVHPAFATPVSATAVEHPSAGGDPYLKSLQPATTEV